MAMVEAAAQKGPAGDALGTVEVAEKTASAAKCGKSCSAGTSRRQRHAPLPPHFTIEEYDGWDHQTWPRAGELAGRTAGTAASTGRQKTERRSARSGAPAMVRRNEHKEQGSNE